MTDPYKPAATRVGETDRMEILFVAGFAPIAADPAAGIAFYRDALGLPLEAVSGDYLAVDGFGGTKHLGEAGRLYATREGLQQMLSKFQEASDSKGYSDAVRNIAQDEAELIRARLTDGDFQVGDQVVLTVAGQPLLTATFPVSSGRVILLPDIGEVSVAGLLRSELQEGLTTRLAKYIRNPEVYAKSQIRLGIFGEITNPGYHTIPAETSYEIRDGP
jgi:hypothetical protein